MIHWSVTTHYVVVDNGTWPHSGCPRYQAKYNVSLSESAFRWLQHHSKLDPEAGDRILMGASNPIQLESNLKERWVLFRLPVKSDLTWRA